MRIPCLSILESPARPVETWHFHPAHRVVVRSTRASSASAEVVTSWVMEVMEG